ncbi:MAG: ribonuclease H-like domain-containing protein [Kiritimatiellaeota bacterium]|nr:ribonuclease H-like domain-containing protein [Kiritimatiellota bacterium]
MAWLSRWARVSFRVLQQTFLHLPGVGPATERRLWQAGLRSWQELADRGGDVLRGPRGDRIRRAAEESQQRWARGDWAWFDAALPGRHKWRAFGDLGGRALYVDIETTGLHASDAITVIGCYDGRTVHSFVADRNLEAVRELIESHPLIVTYNGASFDMPLIRARFPYNFFNHIHIDLRFPLHLLGYRGGLKRIEEMAGLERNDRLRGLDGWDAVRLWHEYQAGCPASLDTLLDYNRVDIVHLEPLMRLVFDRLSKELAV